MRKASSSRALEALHTRFASTHPEWVNRIEVGYISHAVLGEPLNVKAMSGAAAQLVGRHDFVCFRAEDSARPDESTIVVVESAQIEADDAIIQFRIEASHFLWRMVRRIVGCLVKVGKGELSEDAFRRLIDGHPAPSADVAAWTAPASGLFLESVRYKE